MHMMIRRHGPIVYPDSDGKPMAENTLQFQWIATLKGNLDALFHPRDDVFVAGDLLWYPVEGHPELRLAPDVMVVRGRPKGHRGSYMQWLEDDVPVTVAVEILSPGNSYDEMIDKHLFYEEHGVEEYYVYNPDTNRFFPHLRQGEMLRPVPFREAFVSPYLGVRFVRGDRELKVFHPDGSAFLTFEELRLAQQDAEKRAGDAEKRAGDAEKRAGDAEKRADRLAELSRKLLAQQLTADEAEELRRLAGGAA